jgi:CheY-like chemotaxis protein
MTGAKRNKVLLVDDDEALRESLSEQLRLHEDFIMVEAGTGTEALNLAKREHFDAILLDVGLPDIDGREVCRLMRPTWSSRSASRFCWRACERSCVSTSAAKTRSSRSVPTPSSRAPSS